MSHHDKGSTNVFVGTKFDSRCVTAKTYTTYSRAFDMQLVPTEDIIDTPMMFNKRGAIVEITSDKIPPFMLPQFAPNRIKGGMDKESVIGFICTYNGLTPVEVEGQKLMATLLLNQIVHGTSDDLTRLPGKAYVNWIVKMVTSRFHITLEEQEYVAAAAATAWYIGGLHSESDYDEYNLKISVNASTNLNDKFIEGFINSEFFTDEMVKMGSTGLNLPMSEFTGLVLRNSLPNLASIFREEVLPTLASNVWQGYARQAISISSLDSQPMFMSMLYMALTEKSVRQCTFSKMTAILMSIRGNDDIGDTFVMRVKTLLEDSID